MVTGDTVGRLIYRYTPAHDTCVIILDQDKRLVSTMSTLSVTYWLITIMITES